MIDLLDKESSDDLESSYSVADDSDANSSDGFFGSLFSPSKRKISSNCSRVDDFLLTPPSPTVDTKSFTDNELQQLFIKYNTALPSSEAVERLFSLGKNILKPKRCGLTDNHFEMLAFLKSN